MSKQIMVVEDHAGTLALVANAFQRAGFDVVKARSPLTAMHMLENLTPDLFVVDMNVPGMSGVELCRQFRGLARHSLTPIIMLVPHSELGSIEKRVGDCADGFEPKPIFQHDLVSRALLLLGLEQNWNDLREAHHGAGKAEPTDLF